MGRQTQKGGDILNKQMAVIDDDSDEDVIVRRPRIVQRLLAGQQVEEDS
jgi:hypothetical protein